MNPSQTITETSTTITRAARGKIRTHYSLLSAWKKLLLTVSMLLAVVGGGGSLFGLLQSKPPEAVAAQATIESIKSSRPGLQNLTAEQQVSLERAKAQVSAAGHWFYEKTAPHLAKIGIGFAVAFVLGYLFRQFVKTMASLAAIALVGAGVAAYFGWIDFGNFRENLSSSTTWVSNQMEGVKNLVMSLLGAGISGTAGFVIGFMRK